MALTLEHVTKTWRAEDRLVLNDLNLVVEAGSVVCVTGPNGAGKTTLLRIAAGLICPDRGRVRLGALEVERDRTAYQRHVGFVSASPGLYARLTVRDHLRFWSGLTLLPRRERARCCDRTVDAFALSPLLNRRVDRLSTGQRQRLKLARGFLHEPSVVLLDEPANSLDEDGLALVAAETDRMRHAGRAVVSAIPGGAADVLSSDRKLTLHRGRLMDR